MLARDVVKALDSKAAQLYQNFVNICFVCFLARQKLLAIVKGVVVPDHQH